MVPLVVGISYAAGLVGSKLLYGGLANTLCVQRLRHGTNFFSYLRIRAFGGDPNYGGSSIGSTENFNGDENIKNHFYVFKDIEYKHQYFSLNGVTLSSFLRIPHKWVGPRIHVFLSGYNTINKTLLIPKSNYIIIKCIRIFFGVFGGLITLFITPIIKFNIIDTSLFKDDPKYDKMAYMTSETLAPWRIGLLGTLLTGLNTNWPKRIKANPIKFVTGITQLATAATGIALTIFALPYLRIRYASVFARCSPHVFIYSSAFGFIIS